jgi:threonylcarbamoyladenosine tRNA methylthiotransferase MtaB
MPHLHLPMQSGADSVLRRMARRCRSGEFLELVEEGRRRVPQLMVSTDIIVGFPGETDEEWRQTLDFVERAGFGHIHIFAFSPREGTKAAGLPLPVERAVKRERSRQLHELATAHRQRVLHEQVGREVELLVEGRREGDEAGQYWSGYTPNFLKVRLDNDAPDLEGRLVRTRLEAVAGDGEALLGKSPPDSPVP